MVARGNSEPHAAGVPNGTPDLPCIQVHSRWSWRRITGAPPLPRCRAVASKAPPTRRAPERFTCGVRRRSAASAWRPAQPCRALPRPSDVPRETAGHAARANDAALSGPSAYGPTATPLCPHNGSPPDRQPAPEVGRRCTAAASKRCGHQPERVSSAAHRRRPAPLDGHPVLRESAWCRGARPLPQGTADTPPRTSTRGRGDRVATSHGRLDLPSASGQRRPLPLRERL